MAAQEEGGTCWSLCFCCGAWIAVWLVLLGAMGRAQAGCPCQAAGGCELWGSLSHHSEPCSSALLRQCLGQVCCAGWLPHGACGDLAPLSCCPLSLHRDHGCALPWVPCLRPAPGCALCPSPLPAGFALPGFTFAEVEGEPLQVPEEDRELVLQSLFLGCSLGGEQMCLHLLSEHCWAGLTSPSAQLPLLSSLSVHYCFLFVSQWLIKHSLSVAVIYAKINYSLIHRGLVSQFLSLVVPHVFNYCVL